MQDAELVTEICLSLSQGLISSSPKILNDMYKLNDQEFPEIDEYRIRLYEAFDFIIAHLSDLSNTFLMKTYVIHILAVALIFNRFGVDVIEDQVGVQPTGRFVRDLATTKETLYAMAEAHEQKEVEGRYPEYVLSCIAGTNRAPQRTARFQAIYQALNG